MINRNLELKMATIFNGIKKYEMLRDKGLYAQST